MAETGRWARGRQGGARQCYNAPKIRLNDLAGALQRQFFNGLRGVYPGVEYIEVDPACIVEIADERLHGRRVGHIEPSALNPALRGCINRRYGPASRNPNHQPALSGEFDAKRSTQPGGRAGDQRAARSRDAACHC